jgi:hypothetical protein
MGAADLVFDSSSGWSQELSFCGEPFHLLIDGEVSGPNPESLALWRSIEPRLDELVQDALTFLRTDHPNSNLVESGRKLKLKYFKLFSERDYDFSICFLRPLPEVTMWSVLFRDCKPVGGGFDTLIG